MIRKKENCIIMIDYLKESREIFNLQGMLKFTMSVMSKISRNAYKLYSMIFKIIINLK
jgi:hypothetical protein